MVLISGILDPKSSIPTYSWILKKEELSLMKLVSHAVPVLPAVIVKINLSGFFGNVSY